jgi:hypothetical protein
MGTIFIFMGSLLVWKFQHKGRTSNKNVGKGAAFRWNIAMQKKSPGLGAQAT